MLLRVTYGIKTHLPQTCLYLARKARVSSGPSKIKVIRQERACRRKAMTRTQGGWFISIITESGPGARSFVYSRRKSSDYTSQGLNVCSTRHIRSCPRLLKIIKWNAHHVPRSCHARPLPFTAERNKRSLAVGRLRLFLLSTQKKLPSYQVLHGSRLTS